MTNGRCIECHCWKSEIYNLHVDALSSRNRYVVMIDSSRDTRRQRNRVPRPIDRATDPPTDNNHNKVPKTAGDNNGWRKVC